jgi:hypothetical protein
MAVDGHGGHGAVSGLIRACAANPFGSLPEERTKIANDLTVFEPLLRAGADYEIVTTADVLEVVAELELLVRCREPR